MNWGRAKTILIILFFVIDLLLLSALAYMNRNATYITSKTIDETVKVLNARQINISKEQIPPRRNKNISLNMRNELIDPEPAARLFLGDSFYTVLSNDDTHEYEFAAENKTFKISGAEFSYENRRNESYIKSFDEVETALFKELSGWGYNKDKIVFEGIYTEDGQCHVTAMRTYDGIKISGTQISITADAVGILKISGRCLSCLGAEISQEKLLDITAVLINMIYDPQYTNLTVSKIEFAYQVNPRYIENREVQAFPVYIITDAQGQEQIFDARG